MSDSNVLLTAFRGNSAEQLVKYAKGFDILILPNYKCKDSENLIKKIADGTYDYVFSFGQRPNIKDKVHIETTAKDGETVFETDYDCKQLQGLLYISKVQLKTKMVFVHIPFIKNIYNKEAFFANLIEAVSKIKD